MLTQATSLDLALLVIFGTVLMLWFLSTGNEDAIRSMTDEELQAEIEDCMRSGEYSEDLEVEQIRRAGLGARP